MTTLHGALLRSAFDFTNTIAVRRAVLAALATAAFGLTGCQQKSTEPSSDAPTAASSATPSSPTPDATAPATSSTTTTAAGKAPPGNAAAKNAAQAASTGIVKPRAEKSLSMPFYPPDSRRAREEGTVELNLHVLTDGSIDDVGVLKSSGFPRLDEYAVREARTRWRLKPGTVDGKPTPMWHNFRVTFKLSD